ncbi:MAG: VTT domain-containing protein [bacterium]|nr:VTT domain-containing protein [bacterium]
MELLQQLLFYLNPEHLVTLIQTFGIWGYLIIFAIIFAESGLLFGFFFPGDSLLFTAGLFASQGGFNIYPLAAGCFIAAVAGDSVGYYTGHKFGKKLFRKEDSLLFHKDHLLKAEKFYEKHGGKTIILARFMPAVRTFAPIVAGIGSMKYSTFLSYNIFGGLFWAVGMSVAGYFLGTLIPDIDKYLLPIIVFIILASVAPAAYQIVKEKFSK